MCVGLKEGVVSGVRRRLSIMRQGRESLEKGL